jgi:thioredoxin-dependent peroxiredoxin
LYLLCELSVSVVKKPHQISGSGGFMKYHVNVGDRIPRFRVKDSQGREFSEEDIIGDPVVLYFYPKDETPGCTKQACEFRDYLHELEILHTLVFGVSPDGKQAHQNFKTKHHLNFTLLCDETYELARKFDVLHEKEMGGKKVNAIERTTFVIDEGGIIEWIERPVNIEGHIQRVIEAVKKIAD